MNKLVSVIVPVFNNEDFLSECISSILRQTYTNIEIILFDDGSKDNSLRICKDFSEKDGRIKVFSRENKGVSQTRLDAFLMSKGELITFVD
ncbi:MAG: glycosyltransferase family 2 protein, partial [Bacteroidales bacterium]|nr:glycosyltransferase family 2 protein [Bacteroidales bacterium]